MRRLTVPVAALAVFGLGTVADAQPTSRCEIHVLRSPDGVRVAIEEAVRAEKRCDMSLVVRVVPTEKGFYLLAQSPSGKSFEAVVPDARAAAAQVAAWSVPQLIAPDRAEPAEPLPVAPKDPTIFAVPRVRPPGVTPELSNSDAATVPAPGGARRNRYISIGGIVGERTMGGRLALDLAGNRSFSVGVAVGASEMSMVGSEAVDVAGFQFTDVRTLATGAYTMGTPGGTQLRAELGAGVIHTSLTGHSPFAPPGMQFESSGLFPVGEASLQGIVALGASWALSAGPLVTMFSQEYRSSTTNEVMVRRDLDVTVLAQLRRRL